MLDMYAGLLDQTSHPGQIIAPPGNNGPNVAALGHDYTVTADVVIAAGPATTGGGPAVRIVGQQSYVGAVQNVGGGVVAGVICYANGASLAQIGSGGAIVPTAASYHCILKVSGNMLTLTVNGTVIGPVTDNRLGSGLPGVYDIGGVSTFTNLAVTP